MAKNKPLTRSQVDAIADSILKPKKRLTGQEVAKILAPLKEAALNGDDYAAKIIIGLAVFIGNAVRNSQTAPSVN